MLVSFFGDQSQTFDLKASVNWVANGQRQAAKATLLIARDGPGWDRAVIDLRGGFIVKIVNRYGRWVGVCDRPTPTEAGLEVDVHHVSVWASLRRVRDGLTLSATTAGTVLRIAFADAFTGRASTPLVLGAILEAPPLLEEFSFRGQTFLDVLNQLMDETGHVWEIDEQLRFNWLARQGQFRERWLVDDGRLFQQTSPGTMGDQYAETLEVDDQGHTTTIYRNDVPLFWPAQQIVRI